MLRLIRKHSGGRGEKIPLEDKIEAIRRIWIDEENPGETVDWVYTKIGKDAPKNVRGLLGAWRRKIQQSLDAKDERTCTLCVAAGIAKDDDQTETVATPKTADSATPKATAKVGRKASQ